MGVDIRERFRKSSDMGNRRDVMWFLPLGLVVSYWYNKNTLPTLYSTVTVINDFHVTRRQRLTR